MSSQGLIMFYAPQPAFTIWLDASLRCHPPLWPQASQAAWAATQTRNFSKFTKGVLVGYIWVIFGLYLGYIWVIFGLYLGYIWVIFGLYLGYIWVIFELYLGYIWVIFGLYLSYIWAIFGLYLG
jgi:hypothetical protein